MSHPVYHLTGCQQVAFSFVHEPYTGMEMKPELVVYADGSSPPTETKALCGHCFEDLEIIDLTLVPPSRG